MSPPLPILTFLTRFRTFAYLLVFIACAAFAQADGSVPTFILSTAAILLSWWLVESPRGREVPRSLINLGVLFAAVMLFYDLVIESDSNLKPLRALGHFMLAILLCKMFERKDNRGYAQILSLTLLIVVAAIIISAAFSLSLLFAIIVAAYLALGLHTLLLFFLRSEIHAAALANIIPSEHALFLSPDPAIRKNFRRTSGFAAFLLFSFATTTFLCFPRSRANEFFGNWNGNGSNIRTGFSDHVQVAEEGHLVPSDAVVMDVKIEEDGVNIGTEDEQPYFRGMTLDTYNPNIHQWLRAEPDQDNPSNLDFVPFAFGLTGGHEKQLIDPSNYQPIGRKTETYTLYAPASGILFTISPATDLQSDQNLEGAFSEDESTLYLANNVYPTHYTITSALIYTPKRLPPVIYRLPLDPLLDSYEIFGDPLNYVPIQVRRLAHIIAKDVLPKNGPPRTDAQVRAVADCFEIYLQQNYPYSLDFTAVDPTLDPTADFLLNHKKTGAYCEYFASAMAMLCRSVGLNARIVTGYHGGDFNTLGGYYSVKQKYAHSWIEVAIPGRGWVAYDPTPAASLPQTNESMLGTVSHWFRDIGDILQKYWTGTVIAFDNSSRSYLFAQITGFFSAILVSVTGYLDEFVLGFRDLFAYDNSFANRIAALVSTAIILALTIWLVRHWHRRRNSQVEHILRKLDRKAQRQLAHELLFFDDLLRLLARTGCRKLPEQTPHEYVHRLAPALGSASIDAQWLVATFYDIRFGSARSTSPLREKIAKALQNLRQHFA